MKTILFILVALVASPVFGQYGSDTDYWDFQKYNDISKASVRLEVSGLMGSGYGSGSIIEVSDIPHKDSDQMLKAYLLTAAHVINTGSAIKVLFQGGGQ